MHIQTIKPNDAQFAITKKSSTDFFTFHGREETAMHFEQFHIVIIESANQKRKHDI